MLGGSCCKCVTQRIGTQNTFTTMRQRQQQCCTMLVNDAQARRRQRRCCRKITPTSEQAREREGNTHAYENDMTAQAAVTTALRAILVSTAKQTRTEHSHTETCATRCGGKRKTTDAQRHVKTAHTIKLRTRTREPSDER